MSETPRELRGGVCERHGLRFDPATQSGCVLCRRERAAAEAPEARPVRPTTIDAVGPGWLVAALLWLAAGAALYGLHERVLAAFGAVLPVAQQPRGPAGEPP